MSNYYSKSLAYPLTHLPAERLTTPASRNTLRIVKLLYGSILHTAEPHNLS